MSGPALAPTPEEIRDYLLRRMSEASRTRFEEAYFENDATRFGQAAADSMVLFVYIVLVAFLFVRLLGADVVGDPEAKAISDRRKAQRKLAKQQGRRPGQLPGSTITSGESAT